MATCLLFGKLSGGLAAGGVQGTIQLGLAAGSGVRMKNATGTGFVDFGNRGFEVCRGLFQIAGRERSQRALRVGFDDLFGNAIMQTTLRALLESFDR